MRTADLRAFLDAADDLVTAQQALLSEHLPEDIRTLVQAYLEARAILLGSRRTASRRR
jgi:hypothetical protein